MSKKKRKQGKNKVTVEKSNTTKIATKQEEATSQETAAKRQETVSKPEATPEVVQVPEMKEIQEREKATENGAAEAVYSQESATVGTTKKNVVARVFFGGIVIAAILFLAFCLYKTTGELRTVQTMSGDLQTNLQTAETKLEELLKREEAFLAQMEQRDKQEEANRVPDEEQGTTAESGKKPRTTPEPERYTVCIDAGHGAHDTGAVLEAEDGTMRYEKDDNLWLAQLVKEELEAYGVKVVMTREDDSFLELYDRTLLANSVDVDALISFHRNAYYLNGKMSDRVGGVEIWIHSSRPTEARQLANRMLDAILDVGGMDDRGVRYGSMTDHTEDYAINRRALMTSMIVEMGFISNPKDNEDLDANGEAYAKAIAKEIYDWLVE